MPIEINTTGRRPTDSVAYIQFLRENAPAFDDALYQVLRPQERNVDTITRHREFCIDSTANQFRNASPNAVICDRLAALVEHVLENPDETSRADLLAVIETEKLFDYPERLETAKAGFGIRRNDVANRPVRSASTTELAPIELPIPRPGVNPEGDVAELLNWLNTAPTGSGESGLYLVHLVGIAENKKVSVNAQDPRCADRCLHVWDANTKVGKAKNFRAREANYAETFSARARFHPVLILPQHAVHAAESLMKDAFDSYRQRNPFTGRKTEWLGGMSPDATLVHMLRTIRDCGLLTKIPDAKLAPNLSVIL